MIDDGSSDGTADAAAVAGARVLRHPYNKGNGAAVKTGLRNATGTYILIVDADGQHQPHDTVRLVTQLDRLRTRGGSALRRLTGFVVATHRQCTG